MKNVKIFLMACLLGMTALGIYSCSKDNTNPTLPDPGTYSMVSIEATGYNPATLTLVVGSKILWTNTDTTPHTVTSDDGTSFNSGNILPQGTFTFTATQPGAIPYHCSIHPSMQGTLQIVVK